MKKTLSVCLATFNEEKNIGRCLLSIKHITDEIIIVDGGSTDKTVMLAKEYGAKVIVTDNPPIFHINKQKALNLCTRQWILQLDADEVVSPELAKEIEKVISMDEEGVSLYQESLPDRKLFLKHQHLLEQRDGHNDVKKTSFAAFFIPRLNFFLGRYLQYGGVYPDGVIRLIKRGKAHFPCKSVHEQISVDGRVGWLQNSLYHFDSPTFSRYIQRNSRYIDLLAAELQEKKLGNGVLPMLQYMIMLPLSWFFMQYVRHKGFLDSWQGFVFALFSALRFPRAYMKYRNQR